MTEPKSTTRKAAAPSKGAAARAEVADESKTLKTHGLELQLPKELPSEILFDIIESEASEGDANEYLVNLRILRSVVGPDQFMTIRHKIGGDTQQVWELMNSLLESYGLSMGESSASQES